MFRKLRDRFVLSVAAVSAVVISLAFVAVFAMVQETKRAEVYAPIITHGEVVETACREGMISERNRSLDRVVLAAVLTGVCLEVVVCGVSFWWASGAIRPVKEIYDKQKSFVANASHELKTPLAAIQANLEALSDGLDDEDLQWANNMADELEHANKLVREMLALTRLEGQESKCEKKKINASRQLFDELHRFESRLNGRSIEKAIAGNILLDAYGDDFMRVVDILLDNAMKYAVGWIKVELSAENLRVSNGGEEIAEADLAQVFERFFQVDKSRSGSGMGLAIAKTLAERNGWELIAESNEEGVGFELRWKDEH